MTSILRQAKLKLAAIMGLTFASVETDKGTLYYDGEELAVGTEVYVMDEEGNNVLPEDGEYTDGDTTLIVVKGIIDEIKEATKKGPEKKGSKKKKQVKQKMEEELPGGETSGDISIEEFNELVAIVKELVNEVETLKGSVSNVDGELKKALKMSTARAIDNEKPMKGNYESQLNKFGIY